MKTANELASEIVGHQRDECLQHVAPQPGGCTCSHPPKVQVAAIRGTLRSRWGHEWETYAAGNVGGGTYCSRCGTDDHAVPRPCAPPIDDGEKWRMLRDLALLETFGSVSSGFHHAIHSSDEDAIVQLYIAAHDARLLEGVSDD